jgi:hypothetical protein
MVMSPSFGLNNGAELFTLTPHENIANRREFKEHNNGANDSMAESDLGYGQGRHAAGDHP